jgi:hypothetical protein
VRYAANRPKVAARERFPARILRENDGELWLVELMIESSVLSLTRQSNLDALGLDDRVSTGRINLTTREDPDPLLDACGQLVSVASEIGPVERWFCQ